MLSDSQLRAMKPTNKVYRKADGGGLMIQVETSGSKLWRIAYRFGGKQKMLSGGKYPDVGLAAARAWRQLAREIIARGEDPSVVFEVQRQKQAEAKEDHSFKRAAEGWLETQSTWAPRYNRRVANRLRDDVYPEIGGKDVANITEKEILAMLRKVESRGVIETAHRIRGYCSDIFKFARASGWCNADPTADVKDAQKKKPKVRNRAKIMPKDMGSFLAQVRDDTGEELTKLALWFTILTVGRTDEIRFANTAEFERIDHADPLWRLSAERMKMDHEHLVPLSHQAVAIYQRLRKLNSRNNKLFPVNYSQSGVISENRMLDLMYRLGFRRLATVHGFRGTFSTWANETLSYHPDVIEMALSHRVAAASSRGAYNSAVYLEPRRKLLQDWADWLEEQEVLARSSA